MNRRDFLKTTSIGIAATALVPTIAIASNEIPLYKQFDWINMPTCLLYRINSYDDGHYEYGRVPVAVKTWKLKLHSDVNVDYTQETIKETIVATGFKNEILYSYTQTCYTNELFLNETKNLGLTHIYCFGRTLEMIDPITYKPYVGYIVRGVKSPEWKTLNGKLQIVKVNNEGKTEREILINKWKDIIDP